VVDGSSIGRSAPSETHRDCHLGNLSVDPVLGGRTGFLDWAVVCGGRGIRDVACIMCNSITPEHRHSVERALVERYCDLLEQRGVDVDRALVWTRCCVHALSSWVSAAATAGMGDEWQPLSLSLGSTARATAACVDLDTIAVTRALLD
jgi:hypothetical protein